MFNYSFYSIFLKDFTHELNNSQILSLTILIGPEPILHFFLSLTLPHHIVIS
ncbi:hypothetical protein QCO_3687 [Clostridioides difficile CD47]|nr:hypothetical protein QCO_3687 [Clostridioides difficile CD47]